MCGNFVDIKFDDMKILCRNLTDEDNDGKVYKISNKGYLLTPTNRVTLGRKANNSCEYVFTIYKHRVSAARVVAFYFCDKP